MKRRKFPYRKILDVKKSLEDNKKIELKARVSELEVEKEKLKGLNSIKEETLEKDTHDNSLIYLRLKSEYIQQLNRMIDEQIKTVSDFAEKVDKVRDELSKVHKEKRIMEQLEEKFKLDTLNLQKKEETKINSEIALRKITAAKGK
ncbi:MAG: flagellar export protein FliJ [Candidatus Marinimicrobia bacterium]|nr:flagellar export protein FliJ [Candidatus Neomarinimicrobiota bacterium]